MTTLIPDSWELPSYLAGDLIPMDRYRERERSTIPDEEWEPGQNARVFDIDYTRSQRKQRSLPPESDFEQPHTSWSWEGGDIEPFDPSKYHEPAELYSQDALDSLEKSGFQPHEPGVWHRKVTTDAGEELGASHIIMHEPGHRRPTDNTRAPWHLTTDPETVGLAFSTLRGPYGALSAADEDRDQIRKIPKHAGLYLLALSKTSAAHSPGRANADDWLANNPDESFEEDPRAAAHDWMDQHAHEYEHWNPSEHDYTYSDFGDAAGQSFHGGEEEGRSAVLPGSHYHPEADWETGLRHELSRTYVDHPHSSPSDAEQSAWDISPQHALPGEDRPHREGWTPRDWQMFHYEPPSGGRPNTFGDPHEDEDEESEPEEMPDEENLRNHGFDWEAVDPTAGTPENPYTPETPGRYFRHQHDLEGNHVATHTIEPKDNGRYELHTEVGSHGLPVTGPTSSHGSLDWALHKYKQNSAETMLPKYGYDHVRGSGGGVIRWEKSTPHPAGEGHEDHQHEISFPDHGFLGQTENVSNGALFAPNGNQAHHSDDLTEVVREQHRLAQGIHPGGHRDHRLTSQELESDPTVARLGTPMIRDIPWGDRRLSRAEWRQPPSPDNPMGLHVRGDYNWDTGNYDFNYRDGTGTRLAPTHNYVPEGAPVTIPGRAPQLPLESAR